MELLQAAWPAGEPTPQGRHAAMRQLEDAMARATPAQARSEQAGVEARPDLATGAARPGQAGPSRAGRRGPARPGRRRTLALVAAAAAVVALAGGAVIAAGALDRGPVRPADGQAADGPAT